MAFANFSVLAFGSLLMAVPLLLHLLMKKRPQHQIFPALRFLHSRQVANKRQMRLRNWLLLAMRLGAIGLLAALIARPSVDSAGLGYWLRTILLAVIAPLAIAATVYGWIQQKGAALVAGMGLISLLLCSALAYFAFEALTTGESKGLGNAQAPVAAVLVFDTSPRMGLRHQNQTRLDEARKVARELMKQLPADSEVAVVDASSAGTFSVDFGTATNMIDSLHLLGSEYPLQELVLRGIDLVSDRNDKRKEVYVLTELSQQVWQESAFRPVKNKLAEQTDVSMFVLDVGVDKPRNVRLGELVLSSDSLAQGQPLRIETEVSSENVDETLAVKLALEVPDPTLPIIIDDEVKLPESITRDRISQTVSAGSTGTVKFNALTLPVGIHHGQVTVTSNDGLSVDNTRYFTVEVRPASPVLLVTGEDAEARYVENAISPLEFRQTGRAAFDCDVVDIDGMIKQTLTDYAVVALLDPSPMEEQHWIKLADFVRQGGGLAIFLGRNATAGATAGDFNSRAKSVMPAPLKSYWRTTKGDSMFFSPKNTAHPIMSSFDGRQSIVSWDAAPVFIHWALGDLNAGANVVLRYSNNQPAIIESTLGTGRIVCMTTPISDRRGKRPAWNYFPTSDDPDNGFAFFAMMYGLFPYLSDSTDGVWNNDVGQPVQVSTSQDTEEAQDETWQLFTPEGDWQNVRSVGDKLTLASAEAAGTYRLKPSRPTDATLGFSVNLPSQATRLKRIDDNGLDAVLGKDKYILARGNEELNRGIGRARVGRELFPFLMLVVVGLLMMEYLMANRFYATSRPQQQSGVSPAV